MVSGHAATKFDRVSLTCGCTGQDSCHQAKPRCGAGGLYLRDEARLQGCNYLLVIVLCERLARLRPYKSEGRGPQGELCDDLVVRCFNNGHGIILAHYEVKGL